MKKQYRIAVVFLVIAFIAMAGCSATASVSPLPVAPSPSPVAQSPSAATSTLTIGKLSQATFRHNGIDRVYHYYIPSTYKKGDKLPVMFTFHGRGMNSAAQVAESGFDKLAEKEGFIMIAPNAVAIGKDNALTSDGTKTMADLQDLRWNYGIFPLYTQYKVDDLGFISQLIDYLVANVDADSTRIYASGLSSGAFFSIYLATEIPSKIAGVGAVAGQLYKHWDVKIDPKNYVKLVMVNGDQDPIVPFSGISVNDYPSFGTLDSISTILTKYGITTTSEKQELPQTVTGDTTKIVRYSYPSKVNEKAVLYVVEGGGHTWPGGTQYLAKTVIGKLSKQASASELIWNDLKGVHK